MTTLSGVHTAVLACAMLASGCATMSHGVHQNVIIKSDPPGARVMMTGKVLGVTPFVANFWRGENGIVLRFELDGFEAQEVRLKRRASAMLAADAGLSLNPLAGQGMESSADYPAFVATMLATTLGVDVLTGGGYKFPNVVTATLKRVPPPE